MIRLTMLISLLSVAVLSGCADPYRNLYQGMQQRDGIANPAAKPAENPMSYDQYEAERKKFLEQDSGKNHDSEPAN